MALADEAQVTLLLADYIGIDAGGKINAIGAGVQILGWQDGKTAPHHLAVWINVPSKRVGAKFTLSIELRNMDANEVVSVPGPLGQPEAMRVQQLATVERPTIPGMHLPDSISSRIQVALNFVTGLPLSAGHNYRWRLEIDGQHRKGWVTDFYVPEGPALPVFGGPAGSPTIPEVPDPSS